MNIPTPLFLERASDGNSASVPSLGGFVTLVASGDFDGGTLTVQVSPDDGTTWVDSPVTLTAAGVLNFIGGNGLKFRLKLAGAVAPSLSAWVAFER